MRLDILGHQRFEYGPVHACRVRPIVINNSRLRGPIQVHWQPSADFHLQQKNVMISSTSPKVPALHISGVHRSMIDGLGKNYNDGIDLRADRKKKL
jgi:hypothetical protein